MKTRLALLTLFLCAFVVHLPAQVNITNIPNATNITGAKILGLADGGKARLILPAALTVSTAAALTATNWGGINNQATGGDKVTILTNGNVGVGTDNPSEKLSLAETSSGAASKIRLTGNATLIGHEFGRLAGWNTQGSQVEAASLSFLRDGTGDGYFGAIAFNTKNNAERVRITSDGNLGIGTTTPSTLLQVAGTVTATGLTITNGNAIVWGSVTCSNVVDMSESPDSLADALAIVQSHETKNGKVDHSLLSPLAYGKRLAAVPTGRKLTNSIPELVSVVQGVTNTVLARLEIVDETRLETVPDPATRSLSKTVSASMMVIKAQAERIAALETSLAEIVEAVRKLEGR